MNRKPLTIYFAGDLFDAKDLAGNLLFARAVENFSEGRYKVILPQNGESEVRNRTTGSIRDADFELLFECDCIVANFDGPDLDSGTVVEFCFAKMVDMPSVLLRTDFRHSGDQDLNDGVPWNLMCSHYPRTGVLHINGMVRYHEMLTKRLPTAEMLAMYYDSIAAEIVETLDAAVEQKSWLTTGDALRQYQMAIRSIGGSLSGRLPENKLQDIVERKIASGIYN